MKNILFFTLFLTMLFLGSVSAEAANRYVRAGASGSANGNDWTNAYTTLPATLIRGDIYYVADGSYGDLTLRTTASGTTLITIKKATVADHGTETGWVSTYGDGQATFGSVSYGSDYWLFDGQTRNESNWNDGSAYGFKLTGQVSFRRTTGTGGGSHITMQYFDVGGSEGAKCHYNTNTCDVGLGGDLIYIEDWDDNNPNRDLTFSHFRAHNAVLHFQITGADGLVIEYGWLSDNWNKESIRGGNSHVTKNSHIRYNKFVNSCKGHPNLSGAYGVCTGIIAIWAGPSAGAVDSNRIYGNLFIDFNRYPDDQSGCGEGACWTTGVNHTNSCVKIGDTDVGHTPVTNNSAVYNNTFVGMGGYSCSLDIQGGTGNTAYNNVWYHTPVGTTTGCGGTCTNNTEITSGSQFVNAQTEYPGTGFDYHLASATTAGTTLPSPYNKDMDGKTRGGSGTWSLGVYEFGSSADVTPPAVPINVRIQ